MKIKPYIDRLIASKEYKDFQKKNDDSFLIAGFFILDLETQKNLHQIDYYIPSQKKIAAFTVDGGVKMQVLDLMKADIVPEKLDIKTNIDLDALPGILEDEMKNRSITEEIKKIIAIVQTIDGKKIWNLNCILSGMGILKAHVEDESQTVLKMEKSNLMDYMKKLPIGDAIKLQTPGSESKKDLKEKIKGLSKLEKELEQEKEKYEEELQKSPSKSTKKVKSVKAKKVEAE